MADLFLCFGCCVTEQPPPQRRRIDRSMIGIPTNFVHTGHIGSGDMATTTDEETTDHLNCIQVQMKSKGGYEHTNPISIERNVIDIQREEQDTETEEAVPEAASVSEAAVSEE